MIRYAPLLLLIAVCLSCKPAQQQQPAKPTAAGPQIRATVVSIRTTVEPDKKTYQHTLVIAGNRARNTGEHDVWRLYDLKADTVTFVDDVAKTIRTEPLRELVGKRRTTNATALPAHFRPVLIARGGQEKPLHGATAHQVVIGSGASITISSCTLRSMRAPEPCSVSRRSSAIIAIFRMSAAVPWIGAFVAMRSALPRTVNERL